MCLAEGLQRKAENMSGTKCVGAQSVCFTEEIYVLGRAAVVGKKEGD